MSGNGPAKRIAKDDPQTSADAREKGATPNGHGAKSDAVREAAIRALLTEKSIQRAAERCRVNERTLRRWLTDDAAFMTEYDHARQALHRAGMARVQALTGKGVETLEELLDAKKFPAVAVFASTATRTHRSQCREIDSAPCRGLLLSTRRPVRSARAAETRDVRRSPKLSPAMTVFEEPAGHTLEIIPSFERLHATDHSLHID